MKKASSISGTSVSVLLSTIAHDLANPMTSIKAFAQLIAQNGEATPKLKQFAGELLEACGDFQRGTEELRKMFSAYRLNEWDAVDLNESVRRACAELESVPGFPVPELSLSEPAPQSLGEIAQFVALLSALLKRSLDLPAGGRLLALRCRTVRGPQGTGEISIEVEGSGWEETELAFLGTNGLPLSALATAPSLETLAVRAGVHRLHGNLTAERAPEGTTTRFRLCFPGAH